MAWTARSGEDILEFFDDDAELDRKCAELAQLIRDAKHGVYYTGAGVSTSAGIPDFRGPQGVWTMAAQGKKAVSKVSTLAAIPTQTHMALVELQNREKLAHLISSNCDGLHVRSGIKLDKITEVHGNGNLEQCQKCGREFFRDYSVRCRLSPEVVSKLKLEGRAVHHYTGRNCLCGGYLCDTIINFGENLSEKVLEDGFYHGEKADLVVAMGASLTVSPSCDMVGAVKKKKKPGKLVIINLQKTPFDNVADLRIFAKTDDVWRRVMKALDMPIPAFHLKRRFAAWKEPDDRMTLVGLAEDGTPNAWIKNVARVHGPKMLSCHDPMPPIDSFSIPLGADLALFPFGHYNEPPVPIDQAIISKGSAVVSLEYDLHGHWKVQPESDAAKKLLKIKKLISTAVDRDGQNDGNNNNNNNNNKNEIEDDEKSLDSEKTDSFEPPQGGFAVYPKSDCPHAANIDFDQIQIDIAAPCKSCGDKRENWLCLHCGVVACSRYVHAHMVDHVESSKECKDTVLVSYSDFSFWCPSCDSYVTNPRLHLIRRALEAAKFAE